MKIVFYLLGVSILLTSCDKGSEPELPLTDIDGNEYDTVKIGSQFWMKQNLNTSHYSNGDRIPEITNNSLWSSLTSGAWCWYDNDSIKYAAIYGKLYNWYAVNDPRGLSMEGWHVPTHADWATLSMTLGGDSVAGIEMKEKGTTHWLSPNTVATNSSGFTGLPGGYRIQDGTFDNIYTYGIWWSSTESISELAVCGYLNYSFNSFIVSLEHKAAGFSVRCTRD